MNTDDASSIFMNTTNTGHKTKLLLCGIYFYCIKRKIFSILTKISFYASMKKMNSAICNQIALTTPFRKKTLNLYMLDVKKIYSEKMKLGEFPSLEK